MNKRLTKKQMWGFSIGTLGEYFVYFLFYNYFTYYLTDIIGIKAAVASTILSLAMIWDAITDPIVGFVNDISPKKWRRRAMMKKFFVPFCVTFALCYIRPHIPVGPALYIYYGVVCLAFWLSYTCQQVPFYGLLPEIARHPDDRLTIRSIMAFIGNGGNLAVSLVPIIVEVFMGFGLNSELSWAWTMGILGTIGGIGFLATVISTKGLEAPYVEPETKRMNLISSYVEIVKTKGYIISVIIYLLSTLFINLIFSCIMYVGESKLGLPAWQISVISACYTFGGVFITPLISVLDRKMNSHNAFKLSVIVALVGYVIMGVIGFNGMGIMIVHGILTAACFVLFTAYNYMMLYEAADIILLRTGEEKEGSVVAFATFGYKIGSALSATTLGIALTMIGYDGTSEIHDVAMMAKLDYLITFIPAILLVIILILLYVYPVKNKMIVPLRDAKLAKEAGQEYSTKEIESLL